MAVRAADGGQLGHVAGLAGGIFVCMEFQGRLLDPTGGEGWGRHGIEVKMREGHVTRNKGLWPRAVSGAWG